MEYRFLSKSDETLIETSELQVDDGIAVALRSTGYSAEEDEVLELAIVDLDGNELFRKTVKPQNREEWSPSEAAGGIAPTDVEEAPELFQFEGEISEIFEKAPVVVAAHLPFVEAMIDASWVTLPAFEGIDIVELFLASHSSADRPNEPAPIATVDGIAGYYHIEAGDSSASTLGSARLVAQCYRALVGEHAKEREAKGETYWQRYEERRNQETAEERARQVIVQKRERNLNRMNGLLWLCGGIIFASLVIQIYQSGGDAGFMVVCGMASVFCVVRAIANMRK